MLFMIVARHTARNCPGGITRPDRQFTDKIEENMKESGVSVIGGYLDAPGHTFYFVIDAKDNVSLNNALEQFRLVGNVRFYPVMKWSEAIAWTKTIGIQE